ncbi:MAG: hypothetical protein ACK5FU_04925, partial [Bacteroidota bacterium]
DLNNPNGGDAQAKPVAARLTAFFALSLSSTLQQDLNNPNGGDAQAKPVAARLTAFFALSLSSTSLLIASHKKA